MLKLVITLAIIISSVLYSSAQTYEAQQNRMLAYNVLSSGLMGGIGGAINRNEGEKWHKAFIKNFGKACLGGLVKYQAKYQAYYLGQPNNGYWILPNRLHYFIGHSMVMNASLNKGLLDTYYANVWGIDVRVSTAKNPEKRIQARLSVGTLINTAVYLADGHTFNLHRSIEYGHISMDYDSTFILNGRNDIWGIGGYNVMAIKPNEQGIPAYWVIPHETVHMYQYYDIAPLSNLYIKKVEHLYKDKSIYNKLKKYMVFDYEPIIQAGLYAAQPKPTYFKNFYEYEAEHFARRQFIKR